MTSSDPLGLHLEFQSHPGHLPSPLLAFVIITGCRALSMNVWLLP